MLFSKILGLGFYTLKIKKNKHNNSNKISVTRLKTATITTTIIIITTTTTTTTTTRKVKIARHTTCGCSWCCCSALSKMCLYSEFISSTLLILQHLDELFGFISPEMNPLKWIVSSSESPSCKANVKLQWTVEFNKTFGSQSYDCKKMLLCGLYILSNLLWILMIILRG